jgi:hypothetical protein
MQHTCHNNGIDTVESTASVSIYLFLLHIHKRSWIDSQYSVPATVFQMMQFLKSYKMEDLFPCAIYSEPIDIGSLYLYQAILSCT